MNELRIHKLTKMKSKEIRESCLEEKAEIYTNC